MTIPRESTRWFLNSKKLRRNWPRKRHRNICVPTIARCWCWKPSQPKRLPRRREIRRANMNPRLNMKAVATVIAAFSATFTLFAAPCFAQEKQTPPAGGPPKPFTVPAHETYELPNGMKVTLVPYGNLPKVTLSLVVRTGNLNEPADMPGLADLTGKLMKEGTTSKSSQQIAEEAAGMGGAVNISVGVDESDITTDVLSDFAAKAAALLADVAQHPLFPEAELPRLKNDALRQLSISKSVPQSMALERFRKILYGDHPYGTVFPTQESIQKSNVADIRKYYDGNFGAARAHLYVAGRFDTAEMKKAIAAGFGGWAKGPQPD